MFHRKQTATTGGESSAIVTFESEVAAYTLLGLDGAVNPHVCAPGPPPTRAECLAVAGDGCRTTCV